MTTTTYNIKLEAQGSSSLKWIKTVGVRYFNELTQYELFWWKKWGELARNHCPELTEEQSFKESDKGRDLEMSMADVLWVLICLANQTGVDLTKAMKKKL